MKKKRFVSVAAVLLLLLLVTTSTFATPFTPILDEFWIVKDSSEIFRDSFDNSVLPPSGPDGPDTYSMHGAGGMTGESGGRLTMTPSLGEPVVITTTYADLATSGLRMLSTSDDDNFLGFGSSFEIHGLFDMSNLPMVTGQSLGIRASDRALGLENPGNNTFYLFVGVHSITDEIRVFLREHDFTANTSEVLWSSSISALLAGAYQIELVLSKNANSSTLNASYFLYDINDNILGSGSKNNAGTIYDGEDYIRAQFISTDQIPLSADYLAQQDVFCGLDEPDVPCCGLDRPRGLRFGPDDNLYLTSYHDTQRINGTTGACMGKFNFGDPPTVPCPGDPLTMCNPQLLDPSDLVFYNHLTIPSSISLFVTDSSHKRVVRYNGKTGEYISEFIAGSNAGPDGFVIPANIEIGPKTLQPFPSPALPGDIYIRNNNGYSIDSFDPGTGAFKQRIVDFGSSTYPTHFVIGPDLNVYILANYTDWSGGKWFIVQRNDGHTGSYIDRFISLPTAPNQLCLPALAPAPGPPLSCSLESLDSLAFGPDGNLYIKGGWSGGSTYILRFDGTTGNPMDSFAWVLDDKLQYSYGGMIWGQDGKLYVVDRLGNKIRRYWEIPIIECLDIDGDNICDIVDNCPNDPNPGQIDRNLDGEGDACDDSDGDGIVDVEDNCWEMPDDNIDIDSDGLGDACDPDIDGDGIENGNDSCPHDHNNDSDGDTICDDIDPCLNDPVNDPDGDGLCAFEDNCPYDSNPTQNDNDSDGAGDACDICPGEKDLDIDGDGIVDCVDNCLYQANTDQDDTDLNGIGDACDCTDVLQGPNELGVDCGGYCGFQCPVCSWCGNQVTPLRLGNWIWNQGGIDVVFVPEQSYQGNWNQFVNDAIYHIRKGFFQIPDMTVDPLWDPVFGFPYPFDVYGSFNFYLYTGGFARTGDCSGILPNNFGEDAPFRDVAVILFNGAIQGCANGLNAPSHFISSHVCATMHEFGHAGFGLVDEYCGCTYYKQPGIHNVWDNEGNCLNAAREQQWTLGTCQEITCTTDCDNNGQPETISGYWRYDPDQMDNDGDGQFSEDPKNWRDNDRDGYFGEDPRDGIDNDGDGQLDEDPYFPWLRSDDDNDGSIDEDHPDPSIMSGTGNNCSPDYKFYEAAARRINRVLKNWPSSSTKGILTLLNINAGTITEVYSKVVDSHPDIGLQEGPFMFEVISSAKEILQTFEIWDPRIRLGDTAVYIDNVDFMVIFPFSDNLKAFTVKDAETGAALLTVDLTETLKNHCGDNNYEGSECQSLDLDNDGTPDYNDGCPEDNYWTCLAVFD